nr:AAC(3) family N-acetyltransferase [uncultured Duganella sp.]
MNITSASIRHDLSVLGIVPGDVVLVRAALSAVGRVGDGDFLGALLELVGEEGTVASLAFTAGGLAWRAATIAPFTPTSKSYAGALPNAMIAHPQARRSLHPQCSFVAIGRHARELTDGHGPDAGAYEPVRKLMALGGKMLLAGCVASSPGFTTTHLAEVDLGLHRRRIGKRLFVSRYVDEQGRVRVFHRKDPGLCSNSFWKFYAAYVNAGILTAGRVGNAYAICAPAAECYRIERAILADNPRFTICDANDCLTCNLLRWDRVHRWPAYLLRRALRANNA